MNLLSMMRSSAVVVALSVLLAGCGSDEPLPNRRTVDPLTVLYPESRFAGAGDFSRMQVGAPAQDDGLSSPPRGVFKIWRGAAPSVVESVTIHDDANEAAKFFTKSDPREFALDLLPPDDLVGESVPYPAAGAPDTSQIYCSPFHAIGSAECDSWTWWARYGQYTIELRAGSGPSQRTIDRDEFEQIVDLAAAHIAQTVGP